MFALILCGFGFVALMTRKPESGMIAAVLMTVGLGLPIVYIGMFLSQVNMQAARWQLGKGKAVYTVTLRPRDFSVVNQQKAGEAVTVPWSEAAQAFRMRDASICTPARPRRICCRTDRQTRRTPRCETRS